MTSPSDLIPRAEMLRVVDAERDCFTPGSNPHKWLAMVRRDIEDIPAIGTCATCVWAKSGRSPDGDTALECINRPFQLDLSMLGRVRIWVNPDHFCAAYRRRDA